MVIRVIRGQKNQPWPSIRQSRKIKLAKYYYIVTILGIFDISRDRWSAKALLARVLAGEAFTELVPPLR